MNSAKLLWSLMDGPARRRFLGLILLTTLSGFVEILSVGLVIPFIAVASGSLPFGKANVLTQGLLNLLQTLGVPQQYTTIGLGVIFLLGVITANLYLCCFQYYAARVVYTQKCELSLQIIGNLSNHSMEWLDQRNSADLNKVALTDVTQATNLMNAVVQVAAISARCMVVYLFFLLTQARLAIALAVAMGIAYRGVFGIVQRPIQRAGENYIRSYKDQFRAANELIGGARAVRATATQGRFFQRFKLAAQAGIQPQVLRMLPGHYTRAGLETATLAVVIGLLSYFNAKDGSLANGLPLLSSYAVAGIRLLPSVQQAINFILEIRYYAPSLREVARLIQDRPSHDSLANPPQKSLSLKQQLTLEEVVYGYSPEQRVLDGISLTIGRNQRVAFVGETGAGKSTLIDIILALREPQAGSMSVDGLVITQSNAQAWQSNIGYVPQAIYLLDASIAENVAFGFQRQQIDEQRLRQACQAASLTSFIEGLPEQYETFVGERGVRLSGGQCQRIGIARALYHNPEVVIFDEATSALDSQTENSVLEALDQLKGCKTLIVIAHRLNTVWDFDCIYVLEQGRIVGRGRAEELLSSCPVFARLARHQVNLGEASDLLQTRIESLSKTAEYVTPK